ncbi:OmpA family protein [Roseateles sp.]|uniref:OmpA family protein n=1 Tax=Roseateles sp. TaxID=1971397 RepID=UPI003263447A
MTYSNSNSTWCLLTLASLGVLTATSSWARPQESGYFYGGIGVGQTRAKIDEARISASLLGAGLTTSSFARDEKDTGYKLFGGYQLSRNVALELGVFDLGRFNFSATTVPAGVLNGQLKVQGFNLDLVGTLPLTERLSLIGRVGATAARTRDQFTGSGAVAVLNPSPHQRANNYKFGGGLQYDISPAFLVRGEAERYRINDAVGNKGDVNMLSISLVFPFGRAVNTARPMAASSSYVAPAPMPAPVVVAAAPAPAPIPVPVVMPERRRVSFSAESLFGFDRSEIKPEGRAALDRFANDTRGAQFEVIVVEGHTDRLGTPAYNQKLSQRRADAVKTYLVSEGGFDANKVTANGQGEATPVTATADCKGSKPTAKLIACLQPDRRVDIEVTGTR